MQPRLIFDLGGGSLELNFFQRGLLEHRVALPLGTIRLMETYSIEGAIDEDNAHRLRLHTLALLRSAMPSPPKVVASDRCGCGGNAEALVRLASGPFVGRMPTINVRLLKDQTWRLLSLEYSRPNESFPSAGRPRGSDGNSGYYHYDAREVARHSDAACPWRGRARGHTARSGGRTVLRHACRQRKKRTAPKSFSPALGGLGGVSITMSNMRIKWFASRFRCLISFVRCTRWKQTYGWSWKYLLCFMISGDAISHKSHHRHGEYLIRNGEIPGLRGWRCDMVAALIRYHNSKSEPELEHASYAALDGQRRRQARLLTVSAAHRRKT